MKKLTKNKCAWRYFKRETKRPVSMNDAISKVPSEVKAVRLKLSDFAGAWGMSDVKVKKLKKNLEIYGRDGKDNHRYRYSNRLAQRYTTSGRKN
ncbi:MAG: hypothetical protein QXX95_06000 [Nitrososphaerales archaeon]